VPEAANHHGQTFRVTLSDWIEVDLYVMSLNEAKYNSTNCRVRELRREAFGAIDLSQQKPRGCRTGHPEPECPDPPMVIELDRNDPRA